MNRNSLHLHLGIQWFETRRIALPLTMEGIDVGMVFGTTEAARCSARRFQGGVVSFAWRQLLAVGYPPPFREALLKAGIRQALDIMPHLGQGTGDFEFDAKDFLNECYARHGRNLPRNGLRGRSQNGRSFPHHVVADRGESRLSPNDPEWDAYFRALVSTVEPVPRSSLFKPRVEHLFKQFNELGASVPGYDVEHVDGVSDESGGGPTR